MNGYQLVHKRNDQPRLAARFAEQDDDPTGNPFIVQTEWPSAGGSNMKFHHLIKRALIGLTLLLASSAAWAITCDYADDNATGKNPLVSNIALQGGSITVGRDMPEGTVLFGQTYRGSVRIAVRCVGTDGNILRERRFDSTPLPLIPGRPEFQGKVYETGVPGIGVALWFNGNVYPYSTTGPNCGDRCTYVPVIYIDMSFVKTGPISGGVVRGENLPSISEHFVTDNRVEYLRLRFTGSINVVVPTCETPDVNVPLGSHMIHSLTGIGSGTPWRDFEIRLNNCPAISGALRTYAITYSNGDVTPGTRTGHNVNFQLLPNAGSIDAPNGVARLNASAPGDAPSATGIGVQIVNRSNQPIHLARPAFYGGVGMPEGSLAGASFSIPLRARYLQVTDKVTPGPANTAVVFLLNYR